MSQIDPAANPAAATAQRRIRLVRLVRFPLLAVGAAALLTGLWTGLARIGVMLPGGSPQLADRHGALMICGFFGTLISLERAVALGRPWAYAAPSGAAIGVLGMMAMSGAALPMLLFLAASAALTLGTGSILLRQPALSLLILTVAAIAWGIGCLAWLLDRGMAAAIPWWLAFLVLTIAAERLELSRIMRPAPVSQAVFAIAAACVVTGAALTETPQRFAPLLGLGLLGCALWLLIFDVARRTIRQSGQTRFSAVCILAGLAWLALAGIGMLTAPVGDTPFRYDAIVHAITIGFVLSMVFGHALIILPAVTGLQVRYSAIIYGPLALLQASVAIRFLADIEGWAQLRAISGILSVLALLSFALTLIFASISTARSPTH
jgi:hypothetical protein